MTLHLVPGSVGHFVIEDRFGNKIDATRDELARFAVRIIDLLAEAKP